MPRNPLVNIPGISTLPPDNNRHAVYLKLPALPVGHYRLLFSNKPIKVGGYDFHNINFQVTRIAAINTDERIFVLNRKTGFPLAGARIKAFKQKSAITDGVADIIGAKGDIAIAESVADSINITYKGDTAGYKFSMMNNQLRNEVYSKDKDDGLADFYDDKLRMEIFTDRSIYRPGQTVHFKIIFLTSNAGTGDLILFNKQNVSGGIFNRTLKKWLDDGNDKIILKDPFNKKIDSVVLKINDFGSFAGSFTIPKTAATGRWRIGGMPETNYQNNGDFRVEEYKRPTIELSMEKQKKMLLPGEKFAVKLKLRSFSGAELGNIPVKYTISRSGSIPDEKSRSGEDSYITLLEKTGYTNDKGELSVPVNDSAVVKTNLSDSIAWNYTYNITAKAIDQTGESTGLDERLNISSWPIKISIPLDITYDRQQPPVLNVNTSADYEGPVGKKVNIKLYRVDNSNLKKSSIRNVDQWYYNKLDWNSWFPEKAEITGVSETKILILDTIINTADYQKIALPKEKLKPAFYQLIATVKDNDKTVGQSTYSFNVFDSKSGESPENNVDYLPVNAAKPGDVLTWYNTGKTSSYSIYQILYIGGKKKKAIRNIYKTTIEKPGINHWQYQIPADATGQMVLSRITVSNNEIERHEKRIYVNAANTQPLDIIIERYRKVMAPGAKETFTLSVKTKNDNVAAELMTTLYDASLDKLEEHHWNLPNVDPQPYYFNTGWNYALTSVLRAGDYNESSSPFYPGELDKGSPSSGISYALRGQIAGVSINNASGLQEVVVVGYGTQYKRSLTGSVSTVMIRGASSLQDYNQPIIVIDGEIFTGDLKSINPSVITQAMVLKGADASAIYGSRAAHGVLIISTKGPIVLPGSEEPVVKVRKNFNETAFFYPQLHADKDGYYTFSFTMPETATEWNWKMLAHTRKAKFAYLERKLQTQLNLMVQPNMPRLLYQGDKIKLQSRISNLDTLTIKGKATCKIEDAVTGEDITTALTDNSDQAFTLNKKSSGAVLFLLHVPAGQVNPLKIVITAVSAGAADAEEHIIPVLSSRVFIRQSQSIQFGNQSSITLKPIKLPADASLYGAGISITQKPQAALIYALPWLANYSYDCAEQTFNKLRAKVIALRLMQRDTAAQTAFIKAAAFIAQDKSKIAPLPDELADETMPWLGINNHTAQQQKQLFHLLDTSVTKRNIEQHLEKLYKLQQGDGGLTWFEGGKSNTYISAYVLAGFGQLKQMGWIPQTNKLNQQQEFINRLFKYQQDLLINDAEDKYDNLFPLYAMSYWLKESPLPKQLTKKTTTALSVEWEQIDKKSLEEQALLIIVTLRYTNATNPVYQKALQQLENIRQSGIEDASNGLRWKEISDNEDLNSSTEETMALLAEAFELNGKYKDVQTGVVKWLLSAKKDEHWQTTKATAAAINMLQKENGSTFGETKGISAQVANIHLSVSDALLDGTPAAFSAVKQLPEAVTLNQQGINAQGALTWYYFAKPAHLDTLNKAVKMIKQFYSYDSAKGWLKLTPGTVLNPGDRIQVKLTIETSSPLKFVHISDPRAAAFEPAETNSGYHYSNGFSYYQSIKDIGLDLFTEAIPRGVSEISYELIVAHDGEFTSGPARLQCMYRPSITAYSGVEKINCN